MIAVSLSPLSVSATARLLTSQTMHTSKDLVHSKQPNVLPEYLQVANMKYTRARHEEPLWLIYTILTLHTGHNKAISCVYRASYCNVLMWRCVYRASYCNVLMWRCVYRASYCNVLMTNETHNSYTQFYYTVFCLLYMFWTNLVVHHQEHGIIYCTAQFGTTVYCAIQYIVPCSWWWTTRFVRNMYSRQKSME